MKKVQNTFSQVKMRKSIFLKNVKFAKPVAHYLILGRRIFRVFLIAKNEKKFVGGGFFSPRYTKNLRFGKNEFLHWYGTF